VTVKKPACQPQNGRRRLDRGEQGGQILADIRVVASNGFKVDHSSLPENLSLSPISDSTTTSAGVANGFFGTPMRRRPTAADLWDNGDRPSGPNCPSVNPLGYWKMKGGEEEERRRRRAMIDPFVVQYSIITHWIGYVTINIT